MKVLHLATHLNMGGISIYILRLARQMAALGVETHVLSSGGTLTPQFQAAGIATHERNIRTKNEIHPKLYFQLNALARWVRENKFEILHAHTRVTQVLAFWISRMTGVPVVTTCHGFYKPRLGRRLLPAWGERVIAISDLVGADLQKALKAEPARLRMIHNGVDPEELDAQYARHSKASAAASFGFGADSFVIGVIARLVQDKGHEYLIQAMPQLQKNIPELKLLIVGDGPYRAELEALAAKLLKPGTVIFTGSLDDIARPLAAMDIFVLPAVWREGFGLSIIEAMCCRKPAVVTNIWALKTLIKDGETGLLIEPRDCEAITATLLRLYQNPGLRAQLGDAGRQEVLQSFTMKRMAEEVLAVYKELCPSPYIS